MVHTTTAPQDKLVVRDRPVHGELTKADGGGTRRLVGPFDDGRCTAWPRTYCMYNQKKHNRRARTLHSFMRLLV